MIQILCFLVPPTVALILTLRDRNCRSTPVILLGRWIAYAIGLYIAIGITRSLSGRGGMRFGMAAGGQSFLYVHFGMSSMIIAGGLCIAFGLIVPWIRKIMGIKEEIVLHRQKTDTAGGKRILIHVFMLIMLLLTFAYIWAMSTFDSVRFEQIVFHLNMPLNGTADSMITEIFKSVIVRTLIAFAVFELLTSFPARRAYQIRGGKSQRLWFQIFPLHLPSTALAAACLMIWFVGLFSCANRFFAITEFIASQMDQSELYVKDYVDPNTVKITFPEKKRNLITIYLESCETTAQDVENGGIFENCNYIPELTQLAKENISFSHSADKLEGAVIAPACGWTIAGLVAQSAGIPLKLYKSNPTAPADNEMERFAYFLPGAVSIGDILKEAGYRNIFLAGSDFSFAGRRQYYMQHGDYEILDHPAMIEKQWLPEDYHVFWGFEDIKLYRLAKETLTELAEDSQPFNLSLLTVDTHAPEGYVCPICPDIYEDDYGNVWACASRQLADFIDWCRQQPFYENTTIVITGDHASMAPEFFNTEYEKRDGELNRKVYNVFMNSVVEPVNQWNRLFTTMDIFPSTLASMGVTIEGNRLGLGTNLFSDKETLAEQYGYEYLFSEMMKKSDFYDENILYP